MSSPNNNDSSPARSTPPVRPPYVWLVPAILIAVTLVRLWVCSSFELIGDEAYYWRWSKHLDWCYYSKGPLVAWAIYLGTLLLGDSAIGVRLLSILLGTGTLLLLYRLTIQLFSRRIAFWTLILALCTPLFVIGGLLMTIDPLFIFFWMASASLFWKAKNSDRLGPWLLTGALIGLGMLAKYTNVALLPSFALFLLWSSPHRHHLRRPSFWLMCLTALAFLTPVLWWNARHDWITFVHLQERGALDQSWHVSPSEFLAYLVGQLAAYSPFFVVGVLHSMLSRRVRRQAPVAYRFLVSLMLPLLVLYTVLALNDEGEANWTAAAMMSGLPLIAACWLPLYDKNRWARITTRLALSASGIAASILLLAPAVTVPRVEALLYRIRGWDDLATQVERYQTEKDLSFIIGRDYQSASLMSFYMTGHPRTYIPNHEGIENQYSFWPTYGMEQTGQDALYVSRDAHPTATLRAQFERIDPPLKVWSHWRGRRVRTFYLFACRRLRNGAH